MLRPGAPLVEEPMGLEERIAVAGTCAAGLALAPMPLLVDDMANSAERAYEAYPDRLVLVDREGRVAYRSAPGPDGFKPEELLAAIRAERASGLLAPPTGVPPATEVSQATPR